jgi:hypothetical protein
VVPPEDMEKRIRDDLKEHLLSKEGVQEPSMYIGDGFAWILIKAKMRAGYYHTIDKLVQEINAMGVDGFYIRTYTYLATGSSKPFTLEQERIHCMRQEPPAAGVAGLLLRSEDDRFEMKGSLRVDLRKWAHAPEQPPTPDEGVVASALKTVVAFLNSSGGDLLIGALERKHFSHFQENGNHPLSKSPVVGDYLVTGIDFDMKLTKSRDPDGMRLMISDLIRSRIGGSASALVSIEIIKYEDRHLALIRVPKGIGWYYLDEQKFFVRRSGSSVPLEGRSMEEYQRGKAAKK